MKTLEANKMEPFEPTHPGEIIKDEIEYRGISQRALAAQIGVSYTQLNEVLNGKRSLNTELALLISVALDIDAEPLLSLGCFDWRERLMCWLRLLGLKVIVVVGGFGKTIDSFYFCSC